MSNDQNIQVEKLLAEARLKLVSNKTQHLKACASRLRQDVKNVKPMGLETGFVFSDSFTGPGIARPVFFIYNNMTVVVRIMMTSSPFEQFQFPVGLILVNAVRLDLTAESKLESTKKVDNKEPEKMEETDGDGSSYATIFAKSKINLDVKSKVSEKNLRRYKFLCIDDEDNYIIFSAENRDRMWTGDSIDEFVTGVLDDVWTEALDFTNQPYHI